MRYPQIIFEVEDLAHEAIIKVEDFTGEYYRKPRKCKLTTFLYSRFSFYFIDLTRGERSGVVSVFDELPDYPTYTKPFPPAFLGKLSTDARRYVNTILDGSDEFHAYLDKISSKMPMKFAVGKYLGFSFRHVIEIQKEVIAKYIC